MAGKVQRIIGVLGALVVVILASGCVSKQTYEASQQRLATCNHLRAQEELRASDLEQENARLRGEVAKGGNVGQQVESLRRQLEGVLGAGVEVTTVDGRPAIRMDSKVLFAAGSTAIRKGGQSVLRKIGTVLRNELGGQVIRIEGHTDSTPIRRTKNLYKSNWELSTTRAASVLHFLEDNVRIDPSKMYIAGFAFHRAVDSNKTKAGRAKNRRVELVIVPR